MKGAKTVARIEHKSIEHCQASWRHSSIQTVSLKIIDGGVLVNNIRNFFASFPVL